MSHSPLLPDALLADLDTMTGIARAEVTDLTASIAALTTRLEQAQQALARLDATRQTLEEIAARHDTAPQPLPAGYAEILALLTSQETGMRPKEVCRALSLPEEHKTIEGVRAKLKRLVGRNLAQELQPGLFTPNKVTDYQKTL